MNVPTAGYGSGAGHRVVVTGMGAVTSLGTDLASTWQGVISGASGITRIRQYGETTTPTHIAGQVDLASLPVPGACGLGRAARFGLAAADQAWRHAGLERNPPRPEVSGVCIGASTFPIIEDRLDRIGALLDGNRWNWSRYAQLCRENPWLLTQSDAAGVASLIAGRFCLRAFSLTAQAACTSATQAIGHAFHTLRAGGARVILAGGTDSMLSMMCVSGFELLGSLSQRWTDPARASRPFDRTRDGFVLAEGASILVLEEMEHALGRGAAIHGELIGYGSSCDAYRFTDMQPDGDGAVRCMNAALRDAGVSPSQVGYINAHGTATPLNDRTETLAIRRVFGAHADRLAISSTKSQLGHLLCAAGAIELTITTLALKHGILPPTINLDHPDPECDLDYIPWTSRAADVSIALSNSFGFGGQNGCLVVRRWDAPRLRLPPQRQYRSPRKVCITGVGVISPLGLDVATHFARLQRGLRAVVAPVARGIGDLEIPGVARVEGFDSQAAISSRMLRKILTSAASHAVAAAGQALRSSGLPQTALQEAALFVGSLGLDQDLNLFAEALKTSLDSNNRFSYARFASHGTALIDPLFLVKSLPNAGLCGAAIEFDLQGPNLNIMNGAASGLLAVSAAFDAVRSGSSAVAVAGGYDSPLQLETILSHLIEDRLQSASNKDCGYILGEGAAFFVLEDEAHARERNAHVYAEITGVAQSHSASAGASEALYQTASSALGDTIPEAVFGDGVNLPANDAIERETAERIRPGLPIHACTDNTGHCGVASPLFSLLHAALSAYNPALVWTSDRGRVHAAVALQQPPNDSCPG
jgi:3-oxoacyl-[acyl-carrier-protein] synthase II